MTPREIIAQALHDPNSIGCERDWRHESFIEWHARAVEIALTAAGYRLVGPGELDAETVERCADEIRTCSEMLQGQTVCLDIEREVSTYAICEKVIRALSQEAKPNG